MKSRISVVSNIGDDWVRGKAQDYISGKRRLPPLHLGKTESHKAGFL
jgi:hypothetical protein